MDIIFLSAPIPLTKSYAKNADGSIEKSNYPNVANFTSHHERCADMKAFEVLLKKHAAKGHTLLKGTIAKPLVSESRKGSTDSNGHTEYIVFDLDGIPNLATVEQVLTALGITDVSYVVQYSASYKIENNDLRAHVFMQLTKPMAAPLLKQWLIGLNHSVDLLRNAMKLTKTANGLSWPLDITACQNDKLIYIAPPMLKGIKDPLGAKIPRIAYVQKKLNKLDINGAIPTTEVNRTKTDKRINELRVVAGLPERKFQLKMVGSNQVMVKPDSATVSEFKIDRGFVYFNLNGGDSWAYYHPENNPDFIFNFKGEPTYQTKELLPEYWEEITQQETKANSDGVIYLTLLDRKTSNYFRGTYDQKTDRLELFAAKNETQVRHFAKQHGIPLGDFIPEWDMVFEPLSKYRVDVASRKINVYEPTKYGKKKPRKITGVPPTIARTILHALGNDLPSYDHFLNWLACVFQYRTRTLTAWILHGVEGCLAGETKIAVRRGRRTGGKDREITIKQAYEKWSGTYKLGTGLGKTWDMSLPTFSKSVKDGMTVGYHEVYDIVEAGVKQLYKLTTETGRSIRVTDIHPFLCEDGSFIELRDLRPGRRVVVEGEHNAHVAKPKGRTKGRRTTYSIPHHPYAWQHIIGGKNYKRMHTARLVVEADMNCLSLNSFINILRTDAHTAALLNYLDPSMMVHHNDEDVTNDILDNLVVIDKLNHDQHHAREVGLGTINTKVETVVSIEIDKIEMTYDMTMKAPYQNYIANGFAVHNTGKGALMHRIIKPLLGEKQTAIREMGALNEKYNHWMQNVFVIFIDELEARALENEKGVAAKLRNWITDPTITIRAMNQGSFDVENNASFIMASNKPEPVVLTKGDRRHNVAAFQPAKLILTEKDLQSIDAELQDFHDYMMTRTADRALAQTIIQTADRDAMISISETSIDVAIGNVINGNMEFFVDQMPSNDAYKKNALSLNKVEDYKDALLAIIDRTDAKGGCNISRDELRIVFDYTVGNMPMTPNKFTSMLKHHRIHMTKVWIDSKAVQGIKTTWCDVKDLDKLRNVLAPVVKATPKLKSVGGKK